MYNLANSWEEKALKVRLEMLSMADRKFKTNLQRLRSYGYHVELCFLQEPYRFEIYIYNTAVFHISLELMTRCTKLI